MHMYAYLFIFDAFLCIFVDPGEPWGDPGVGDPGGNLVFSQVRCLSTFSSLLELATDAADATDATEVVSSTTARTPPSTRAGGQDDMS